MAARGGGKVMTALLLLLALLASDAHAAGRLLLDAKAAKGANKADSANKADQWGSPYGGGGGPYGYNDWGGGGNGRGRGNGRWNNGGGRWNNNNNPYSFNGNGGNADYWARRRYDRSYLRGITPGLGRPSGGYAGPVDPWASRWSQNLASADARAAAQSLAGVSPDIAGQGIFDAAAAGRRQRLGAVLGDAAALNRGATARALARGANYALLRGQTSVYADAAADMFVEARRRGNVRPLGLAMADAVAQSGDYGAYTYGTAIAKAVAGGGDGQAAVAEATAEVFCAGDGTYADAWSSAFSIALNQDQNGCLVLSQARAMAQASCGGGLFNSAPTSSASSDATSTVLGFCGLLPGLIPSFNFNSGNSGGNSFSG